jgi:lycopene cyclase-like protein
LHRRLAAVGATLGEAEATEHVAFSMGGPVPPVQRVVGFGAAAGMVHPATGYQVAAALRRAPAVARSLALALGGAASSDEAAVAAWAAVWPADLRRQRELHAYGLEILLGLDAGEIQRFFAAFFDLPPRRWQAYVSGAASSRDLAAVMLQVARRLPPPLRRRVVGGAIGSDGLALLRAVVARAEVGGEG